MNQEKQRPIMSRDVANSGYQAENGLMRGEYDIKVQNNTRQIATALATGLVVGLGTTVGMFASNPQMLTGALPPMLAALGATLIVAAANWFRGQPVEQVAKDIVDRVLGEDHGTDAE